ncbi:RNA degradosome polyphosphate kinase, partial [Staphylococcus sp. SIMBA_130]
QPLIYLASADLMTRNLSKRIEVAFPINNERARSLLLSQLNGQLQDNVKGRQATGKKANHMLPGKESISSQEKMFQLVSNYNVQDAI